MAPKKETPLPSPGKTAPNVSALMLYAIVFLNVVLLIVNITKAVSSETSENFRELVRKEKNTFLNALLTEMNKLDGDGKRVKGDIEALSKNLGSPDAIKAKFDNEINPSLQLINRKVSNIKSEMADLNKKISQLTVELANLHEQMNEKKK